MNLLHEVLAVLPSVDYKIKIQFEKESF